MRGFIGRGGHAGPPCQQTRRELIRSWVKRRAQRKLHFAMRRWSNASQTGNAGANQSGGWSIVSRGMTLLDILLHFQFVGQDLKRSSETVLRPSIPSILRSERLGMLAVVYLSASTGPLFETMRISAALQSRKHARAIIRRIERSPVRKMASLGAQDGYEEVFMKAASK